MVAYGDGPCLNSKRDVFLRLIGAVVPTTAYHPVSATIKKIEISLTGSLFGLLHSACLGCLCSAVLCFW